MLSYKDLHKKLTVLDNLIEGIKEVNIEYDHEMTQTTSISQVINDNLGLTHYSYGTLIEELKRYNTPITDVVISKDEFAVSISFTKRDLHNLDFTEVEMLYLMNVHVMYENPEDKRLFISYLRLSLELLDNKYQNL